MCVSVCDPMDCSPLVSSVHEIFQARIKLTKQYKCRVWERASIRDLGSGLVGGVWALELKLHGKLFCGISLGRPIGWCPNKPNGQRPTKQVPVPGAAAPPTDVTFCLNTHGQEGKRLLLRVTELIPWSPPLLGFTGGSVVKNSPASTGDTEVVGSIPGSGRFLKSKMATHSSILGFQSKGSKKFRHN